MTLLEFTGFDWRIVFTVVAALLLIGSQIYALYIPQGKRFWWIALVATGLIVAALWFSGAILRTILMDLAALVLVFLVWNQDKSAGKLFLTAVLLGSVLVGLGMAFGGLFSEGATQPEGMTAKVVISLLLLGFMIKLAAIPFAFWLAPVAEKSSVMSVVMVISLLDMAEFGELAALRVEIPWLFSNIQWIWIALALLSMFGGALLALAQTNVRRMLAFSTIDDVGYLLLGLAAGTVGGVLGAVIGAVSHSLCKFLLFGAVGVAEKGANHSLTTADRGMAGKHPAAGAAFIVGSIGMIGVPPLLGFLGRWRLYFSGLEAGGVGLAIAMAVATGLALLYYVRIIHKVWLGQAADDSPTEPKQFFWINAILIVFIVLLILTGLFPAIFPGLGGR